jgi:predicted nucleic acid-binding Zn ribbon protein
MEGTYAFQCADCSEIFDTVVQWVQHALDQHSEILPGIEPVRKQ